MRVVTPFRVACVGITFVLAVNVSSILPFVFETASSPSAPGRLEARPSRASASVVAPAAGAAATGARPTELATAAATASAEPAACVGRKPYHVILTATSQVYQQWQCRVMYRHWLKQKALDPKGACTEMTGFTRLVASAGGRADGVEDEVPTLFVLEYTPEELNRFHGYRVINRPYSIVQLLKLPYWRERIPEEYVLIAETDHIFMHAIPNTAALHAPATYVFNYMGINPDFEKIVHRVWPVGGATEPPNFRNVQPIGPSPVLIHKADLERVAAVWHAKAMALKTDPEAERRLGWVIEMWGYAVASASIGLRHTLFPDFQVEPGALSSPAQLSRFLERYWILHYTYQFEYYLDSTPCRPWTIGEFSLDKRHFSDSYPQRPLPLPPPKANVAAFFLVNALNEAMGNISGWPTPDGRGKPAGARVSEQSVYGRRRASWFGRHDNGFRTERRIMPLIEALVGTRWACAGKGLEPFDLQLLDGGDASSSRRGRARWASMNNPELVAYCPIGACIYVDGGGEQANVRVAPSNAALHAFDDRKRTGDELWACTPAPAA